MREKGPQHGTKAFELTFGTLWPVHPRIREGELFSSWLIRTAIGNSTKVQTFCHLIWPKRQIWTRDIDLVEADDLISVLARKTATDQNRIRDSFLQTYEGKMFKTIKLNTVNPWIRRVGIYHRLRRRHGLMYCPLCLESDEIPYFRKLWRTNLSPICLTHATVLRDCCQGCGSTVMPHRGDIMECDSCGHDLRDAKAWSCDPDALSLAQTLVARAYGLPRHEFNVPHETDNAEFFAIVSLVMRCLTSGARREWLHLQVLKHSAMPVRRIPKLPVAEAFENLRANDLHTVFRLSSILMRGWPWMFIGHCSEARVWKSWICPDSRHYTPKELYSIAQNYLTGPLSY